MAAELSRLVDLTTRKPFGCFESFRDTLIRLLVEGFFYHPSSSVSKHSSFVSGCEPLLETLPGKDSPSQLSTSQMTCVTMSSNFVLQKGLQRKLIMLRKCLYYTSLKRSSRELSLPLLYPASSAKFC